MQRLDEYGMMDMVLKTEVSIATLKIIYIF